MDINKKYIEEEGNPKEAIIALEDFREIEEILGWDLSMKRPSNSFTRPRGIEKGEIKKHM